VTVRGFGGYSGDNGHVADGSIFVGIVEWVKKRGQMGERGVGFTGGGKGTYHAGKEGS